MPYTRAKTALILLFGAALTCIGSLAQQQRTDDFLSQQRISSIAVLPPLGESVPSSARQLAGDLFVTKLKSRSAGVRLMAADETLSRLQQKEATNDFAVLVTTFSQTGIVNADLLKKIGQATGTDALLLIYVLNYDEEKGSWWYGKGGKNVCRIQYTLFRSSDAEKIWETLEFRQHDSKLSTSPYPMERVIGDVSDKAIASLLIGKQHTDVRQKNTK
jgi:hypothetical protein